MTILSVKSKRISILPPFFVAISLLFALQVVPVLTPSANASTWYIKPSNEIPVRRGKGTDYKIIAVLSSATEVTIAEEQLPWVKIRTQNGKVGWMLKRYLSDQPPLSRVVEELTLKNDELLEQETLLKQDLSSANVQIKQISSERNSCIADLSKIKDDYQFLKTESADVMAIRNNLIKSEEKVKALTLELQVVAEESLRMKKSQKIRWYLAGAGTLLFGWLAGLMSTRSKKRRSSLY